MLTACPSGANSVAGSSSIAACTCPLSYILNGTTSCRPCRSPCEKVLNLNSKRLWADANRHRPFLL